MPKTKLLSCSSLEREVQKAASMLREGRYKDLVIVSHTDADGICGSIILEEALKRLGLNVGDIYHIEKTYTEVIKRIYGAIEKKYEIGKVGVVFIDVGSEKLNDIGTLSNKLGVPSIIIDHHSREVVKGEVIPSNVVNLNCEDYSISGERELAATTIAYILAKNIDKNNVDLSYLAMIGALDDCRALENGNQVSVDDAVKYKVDTKAGKSSLVAYDFDRSEERRV